MASLRPTAVALPKPRYRGISHQFGFFAVLGAAPTLMAFATGTRAVAGAMVYGLSLMAMLGFSTLYHRTNPSLRVEKWLERLDHSAIFIFIAGSYTPFCLLLEERGPLLLSIVWTGAVLGVLTSLFWIDAPRWIAVTLYLVVGWTILPFVGHLWSRLGSTGIALLVVGGVLYSVGAVVFARERPDPLPRVFGFHEVFHALVVVACICHFVAVGQAVMRLSVAG